MKLFAIALSILLTACGGGGSDIAPAPAAPAPVAPAPPPPPVPVLVAAFGDSTQGEQGSPHAASRPEFTVENRGIGATTTAHRLVDWPETLRNTPAKIVTLKYGINEYRLPGNDKLALFRSNLRALVEQAQAAGKRVILEVPHPVGDPPTPLMQELAFDVYAYEDRRKAIMELGAHMGVYVCVHGTVPLYDGIHQDAEGVVIVGRRLAICLQEVLG